LEKSWRILSRGVSFKERTKITPQTLFKKFKDDVIHVCGERAKKFETLKEKLTEVLNNPNEPESEKTLVGETLQEKVYGLERKHHMRIRDNSAAIHWLEAETTVTDFWTKTNKTNAQIRPNM
jgi:Fe2+ transport system protein B